MYTLKELPADIHTDKKITFTVFSDIFAVFFKKTTLFLLFLLNSFAFSILFVIHINLFEFSSKDCLNCKQNCYQYNEFLDT